MATIASMIYSLEAQVSQMTSAMADVKTAVDSAESSMLSSIITGAALGSALEAMGAQALDAFKEIAESIPDLALQGAVAGDVAAAFERLATSAGLLGDELLTTLRAGTHGTIDDFNLMQMANRDLAAGMDLTEAQFGTLSQGAFALAKATGGDVKTALDSMNDAMLTGRVRALALLTGKIDLKAAEEAFAEALGGTAAQLTAEGKLEADREAILSAVEAATGRLGDQTDNLSDKVTQGRVAWANFEDQLGQAIAKSPVIAAGFDSIRASLLAAFGGDQQQVITALAGVVDSAALKIVDMGIGATAVATVFLTVWSAIETVVLAVETALVGLVTAIAHGYSGLAQLVALLPGATQETQNMSAAAQASAASWDRTTIALAQQTAEAARGVVGQSAAEQAIDKVGGALFVMRDSMVAAQAAQVSQTTATVAFVGPMEAATTAVKDHAPYLKDAKDKTDAYTTALNNVNATGTTWQETLAGQDQGLMADVQTMLKAGASAHDLGIAWGLLPPIIKANQDAIKAGTDAVKLQEGQWAELQKDTDAYYKAVNAASHDTVSAQVNDAYVAADAKIAAMQKSKTYSIAAEMEVWATADQVANNIIQKNLESDVSTKDHYQLLADKAAAAYDFALQHATSYTDARLLQLRSESDAAQLTLGNWQAAADAALTKTASAAGIATSAIMAMNAAMTGTVTSQFSLNPLDPGSWAAKIASFGDTARLAYDSNHNPYVYIPGVNAAPPQGFAQGTNGFQDFGSGTLAMLHGVEAVIPQRSTGSGLGATNIYISVTQPLGTPQQIAAVVGPALLASARSLGIRMPAGVGS